MKDFFRVMGKAFAVVFGSTSALALVLVLLVLAMRPVLRSWSQTRQVDKPPAADGDKVFYYDSQGNRITREQFQSAQNSPCYDEKGRIASCDGKPHPDCIRWNEEARCVGYGPEPESQEQLAAEWKRQQQLAALSIRDCNKAGCVVYKGNTVVGRISRDEWNKATGVRDLGEIK